MPTVTIRLSAEQAVGELLTLTCESAGSQVVIAPRRGGPVTSFSVAGRELLYLDPSTLNDERKNVRGGIPVLFPSPGKLEGDVFRIGSRTGSLKQHGFARNLAWTVAETRAHADRAEAKLELVSNETTLAGYPWEFRMELGFTLQGTSLSIESRVKNESATIMPFALGYHPYFHVSDK
jgi:galactose mutarotase-like enzyme